MDRISTLIPWRYSCLCLCWPAANSIRTTSSWPLLDALARAVHPFLLSMTAIFAPFIGLRKNQKQSKYGIISEKNRIAVIQTKMRSLQNYGQKQLNMIQTISKQVAKSVRILVCVQLFVNWPSSNNKRAASALPYEAAQNRAVNPCESWRFTWASSIRLQDKPNTKSAYNFSKNKIEKIYQPQKYFNDIKSKILQSTTRNANKWWEQIQK